MTRIELPEMMMGKEYDALSNVGKHGYVAYFQGALVGSCPYITIGNRERWRQGWDLAASEIDGNKNDHQEAADEYGYAIAGAEAFESLK